MTDCDQQEQQSFSPSDCGTMTTRSRTTKRQKSEMLEASSLSGIRRQTGSLQFSLPPLLQLLRLLPSPITNAPKVQPKIKDCAFLLTGNKTNKKWRPLSVCDARMMLWQRQPEHFVVLSYYSQQLLPISDALLYRRRRRRQRRRRRRRSRRQQQLKRQVPMTMAMIMKMVKMLEAAMMECGLRLPAHLSSVIIDSKCSFVLLLLPSSSTSSLIVIDAAAAMEAAAFKQNDGNSSSNSLIFTNAFSSRFHLTQLNHEIVPFGQNCFLCLHLNVSNSFFNHPLLRCCFANFDQLMRIVAKKPIVTVSKPTDALSTTANYGASNDDENNNNNNKDDDGAVIKTLDDVNVVDDDNFVSDRCCFVVTMTQQSLPQNDIPKKWCVPIVADQEQQQQQQQPVHIAASIKNNDETYCDNDDDSDGYGDNRTERGIVGTKYATGSNVYLNSSNNNNNNQSATTINSTTFIDFRTLVQLGKRTRDLIRQRLLPSTFGLLFGGGSGENSMSGGGGGGGGSTSNTNVVSASQSSTSSSSVSSSPWNNSTNNTTNPWGQSTNSGTGSGANNNNSGTGVGGSSSSSSSGNNRVGPLLQQMISSSDNNNNKSNANASTNANGSCWAKQQQQQQQQQAKPTSMDTKGLTNNGNKMGMMMNASSSGGVGGGGGGGGSASGVSDAIGSNATLDMADNNLKAHVNRLNVMREALFSTDSWSSSNVTLVKNWDTHLLQQEQQSHQQLHHQHLLHHQQQQQQQQSMNGGGVVGGGGAKQQHDQLMGPGMQMASSSAAASSASTSSSVVKAAAANSGTEIWESNLRNGGQGMASGVGGGQPANVQKTPWGHTPSKNIGGTWGEEEDSNEIVVGANATISSNTMWNSNNVPNSGGGGGGASASAAGVVGNSSSQAWCNSVTSPAPVAITQNAWATNNTNNDARLMSGCGVGSGVGTGGVGTNGDISRASSATLGLIDTRDNLMRNSVNMVPGNSVPDLNARMVAAAAAGGPNGNRVMASSAAVTNDWRASMQAQSSHKMPQSNAQQQQGQGQQWSNIPKELSTKNTNSWDEVSPPMQRRNMTNYDDGTSLWGAPSSNNGPDNSVVMAQAAAAVAEQQAAQNRIKQEAAAVAAAAAAAASSWAMNSMPSSTARSAVAAGNVPWDENHSIVGSSSWATASDDHHRNRSSPSSSATSAWGKPKPLSNNSNNPNANNSNTNSNNTNGSASVANQLWGSSGGACNVAVNETESAAVASDWQSKTGYGAASTNSGLNKSSVGMSGSMLSKEMIYNSKQFRLLIEMGYKRDEVEATLRRFDMSIEDALYALGPIRTNSLDSWRTNSTVSDNNSLMSGGSAGGNRHDDYHVDNTNSFSSRFVQSSQLSFPNAASSANLLNSMNNSNMSSNSHSGANISQSLLSTGNSNMTRNMMALANSGPVGIAGANSNSAAVAAAAAAGHLNNAPHVRSIVSQIQTAISNGFLNPQVLLQPFTPQILMLLNNLLTLVKQLQHVTQQYNMHQNQATKNSTFATISMQHSVQINKLKQSIANLQNHITAQQQQQQQHQQQQSSAMNSGGGGGGQVANSVAAGGGGNGGGGNNQNFYKSNDSINSMQSNFTDMSLSVAPTKEPLMSRLNQWKLPSSSASLDSGTKDFDMDFSRAPGSAKSSATSSSTLSLGFSHTEGPWANTRLTADTTSGWPDANDSTDLKDITSGSHWGQQQQSTAAAVAALAVQSSITDLVPEFEPGKPWKGSQQIKSIEEDPNITPGSALSSLVTLKDNEMYYSTSAMNASKSSSPTNSILDNWSFPQQQQQQQHHQQPQHHHSSIGSGNQSAFSSTQQQQQHYQQHALNNKLTGATTGPKTSGNWSTEQHHQQQQQQQQHHQQQQQHHHNPHDMWTNMSPSKARGPPPGLTKNSLVNGWSNSMPISSNRNAAAAAAAAASSTTGTGSWSSQSNLNNWATTGNNNSNSSGTSNNNNNNASSTSPITSSPWLLLRNLNAQIDGSTLRTLCMQHGPLQNFQLFMHQGFALAKYSSCDEATKAQIALNNCVLGNTTIMTESPSDAEVNGLFAPAQPQPQPPLQQQQVLLNQAVSAAVAAQNNWRASVNKLGSAATSSSSSSLLHSADDNWCSQLNQNAWPSNATTAVTAAAATSSSPSSAAVASTPTSVGSTSNLWNSVNSLDNSDTSRTTTASATSSTAAAAAASNINNFLPGDLLGGESM